MRLPSAIGEHPRLLAKDNDLAGSSPDRLHKCSTSYSMVRDQCNQLLDVGVVVVPQLDPIRQLLRFAGHNSIKNKA